MICQINIFVQVPYNGNFIFVIFKKEFWKKVPGAETILNNSSFTQEIPLENFRISK